MILVWLTITTQNCIIVSNIPNHMHNSGYHGHRKVRAINLHVYIFFQETAIRSEEEVSMFDKLIIGHITTQRALTSEAIPALEQPSELRV